MSNKLITEILNRSGISINEDESDVTYFESRITSMFDSLFNALKSTLGIPDDNYYPYNRQSLDRLAELSNEDREHLKAMCIRKLGYAKKLFFEALEPIDEVDLEPEDEVDLEPEDE